MNTKGIVTTLMVSIVTLSAFSQVTENERKLRVIQTDTVIGWKKGIATSLNMSQTSLINWSSGGENSYSINGMISTFATYKSPTTSWENTLDMGYGLMQQGSKGMQKTDDRFDLTSKYGKKAFSNFYYTGLMNFKSQFAPGYNYDQIPNIKTSNILAPAYLLAAIGLNYLPNPYFNAFIAPLTGKLTIVADTALSNRGTFGVTPGNKSRSEFGGYARFSFTKNDFKPEFLKNVSLSSKLDLFSNYLNNPQNVDVSWENILLMKVNKYVGITLNTHLLYDADIKDPIDGKAKIQFKEILGVGFSYKF